MKQETLEETEKTWEKWLKLLIKSKGEAEFKREGDKLVFSFDNESVTITKDFLNQKMKDRQMSPFLYLISCCQNFANQNNFTLSTDFFSQLIALGADVNIQNNLGESPLHLAVWIPDIKLATLLLNHGADINLTTTSSTNVNNVGQTPLMWAVDTNNIEMTQLLLSKNPDITIKDSGGLTVRSIANSDTLRNLLIPLQTFNDLLDESPKIIQQYMKWTAFPKLNEKKITQHKQEAKASIKDFNFDKLTENPEIKRTLFNLIFYMNTLPAKDKKKAELKKFISELSDVSLEEANQKCSTALKDSENLVKNRAIFGGYKFFHSLPNNIINKNRNNRLARSTTEELLIDFNKALENAENTSETSEDLDISDISDISNLSQ